MKFEQTVLLAAKRSIFFKRVANEYVCSKPKKCHQTLLLIVRRIIFSLPSFLKNILRFAVSSTVCSNFIGWYKQISLLSLF